METWLGRLVTSSHPEQVQHAHEQQEQVMSTCNVIGGRVGMGWVAGVVVGEWQWDGCGWTGTKCGSGRLTEGGMAQRKKLGLLDPGQIN